MSGESPISEREAIEVSAALAKLHPRVFEAVAMSHLAWMPLAELGDFTRQLRRLRDERGTS